VKYAAWQAEQERQRAPKPYADVRIYPGDRFAIIGPDGELEVWHLEKIGIPHVPIHDPRRAVADGGGGAGRGLVIGPK